MNLFKGFDNFGDKGRLFDPFGIWTSGGLMFIFGI